MTAKPRKPKEGREEDSKAIAKDLKDISAISALANMEGSKVLVKNLAKDVIGSIDKLSNNFSTYSLQEFVGIGASLREKIEMIRVFTRADENKKFLEELLEETLTETE